MPDDPRDPSPDVSHQVRLHFDAAHIGRKAPTLPAAAAERPSVPPPLADAEQSWLDAIEREAAAFSRSLDTAFPAYAPATPAQIGQVIVHTQQIGAWYASFLPVAEKLAARGHTRLIESVKRHLEDNQKTRAIFEKMRSDAASSQSANAAIVRASNDDTFLRFGAMHDARQAVLDGLNDDWSKHFNAR